MATTLFPRFNESSDGSVVPGIHLGTDSAKLNGVAGTWDAMLLTTTRGVAVGGQAVSSPTVTGPTNGVESAFSSSAIEWFSLPLAAAATISGTITLNIWSVENNMSANVAINAIIQRLGSTGTVISTIAQTARTTELGTTAAAANFTVTPTSTNMAKGDRIRVRFYGDDSAAATMAATFTFSIWVGGNTGAAQGDTFITFTENLTFQTSDPATTTMYLTDTSGPTVASFVSKEMWTSRGAGVTSIGQDTTPGGWTSGIQWRNSGGATDPYEWYSRPLQAFTLADLVKVNLRVENATASSGLRAELAVCNGDGTGATVWGSSCIVDSATPGAALGAGTSKYGRVQLTEAAVRGWLSGPDVSVTAGQRLRLRVYVDDTAENPLSTSSTSTLYYAGTSGGASGDSFIILGQSVAEAVTYVRPAVIVGPSQAVHQSHNW